MRAVELISEAFLFSSVINIDDIKVVEKFLGRRVPKQHGRRDRD
jgi:hypothetical protein